MKKLFGIVCGFVLLFCFSCHQEDARNTPLDLSFYQNVGKEIPFDLGMRWLQAYEARNAEGRTQTASYAIPALQLNTLLSSVPNLTGVAFHYGTDTWGTTHIIAIPIDPALSLWTVIPGRVIVDTNTGLAISQSTAELWTSAYKNNHPGEIWFHYFGKTVFDEITSLSFLNTLDVSPAFNDTEQTPELLLIVWDNSLTGGLLGRRKDDPGRVYDASNACPPCSVQ
jgi:hypothetical protein